MRAYVDTDVLVWQLRGERKAEDFLRRLARDGQYELWTGAMQRAEVFFFMRPEEEAATRLLLARFRTAPVTQEIVDKAAVLFRRWHPSHGVDMNDALLAATSMEAGGRIFCLNMKHYPMPDVLTTKAW